MEERHYLVYCHTSPSGKRYIGQTKDYVTRSRRHTHNTKKGCTAFKNAIQKYGWDNFKHEIILDNLTLSEANELEEFLIEEANTLSPNGYNLVKGGENYERSVETKRRMSKSKKGIVGSEHPLSKRYTFISPDGIEISFKGLAEFCRKNGLPVGAMCKLHSGKYRSCRGYTK